MIKFYIAGSEVQVQVSPLFTETLDETLDSGSCILGFSTKEEAYLPDTAFQIVDTITSETLNFIIVSDIVETVDKATPQYRHTITFTQRSRLLSKYALRNMVFSQPAKPIIRANDTTLYIVDYVSEEYVLTENVAGSYQNNVVLGKRAKVKKAWAEIKLYGIVNDTNPSTITEITDTNIIVGINVGIQGGSVLISNQPCNIGINELDIDVSDISGSDELYIEKTIMVSEAGQYSAYNNLVVHARLYVETYYYTLYDVLTKIQKSLRKMTNLYANSDIFTLPISGDFYNALQQPAPEFSLTQMNAYEAIDQVAKYLDGVITLSATNVLGIEYFHDLSNATAFTSGKADQNSNISEDTYINGLISNYQNARAKDAVWYPSANGYDMSKSNTVGVADTTTRVIKLPESIESIEKVLVIATFQSSVIGTSYDFANIEVDISDYVVEKSIYDLLPSTNSEFYGGDTSIKTNYNTIYYEKGGNTIHIGQIVHTIVGDTYNLPRAIAAAVREQFAAGLTSGTITSISPSTPINLYYKILYRPSFSGRLKIEGQENKFAGEMLIEQSGGKVDLSKLGSSMFGLAVKLGQESKIIVQEFKTFATRARKGMVYTDGDGDKWFANKVKTTIFPSYVSCEIEFSKNFNKLSQYIQVNQSKRFYEISNELTTTAEDNYCEYVYIGKGLASTYTGLLQRTCADNLLLSETMKYNFVQLLEQPYLIDFARIRTWTDYVGGIANSISSNLNIPLIMFGAGNSLVYKVSFDNSISAGTRVTTSSPYISSVISYADTDGFFELADIDFRLLREKDIDVQIEFASELPVISGDILDGSVSKVMIDINMLRFYKDPNEIFKLNYQLTFLPYQINDVFIGRTFIENNILQNHYYSGITKIYASTTIKYSILDVKAVGTELGDLKTDYKLIANIQEAETGYCEQFAIRNKNTLANLDTTNYTSWCIADEFDNIIIAFNKIVGVSETARFTIFSRHTRL